MTHREAPWLEARGSLPFEASSNEVITHAAMRAYYSCASSREQKIVMTFGQKSNELISFMQEMSDADGVLLDELSDFDLDSAPARRSCALD